LGLVCVLTFLLIFKAVNGGLGQQPPRDPEIIFSDFLNQVDKGQVAQVTIEGHSIRGQLLSGEHFRTYAPDDTELIKTLREKGVKIMAKPEGEEP
jgi:cell division protease FtsH